MVEQVYEMVRSLIQDHGSELLLSLLSFLAGGLVGRWQAWRRWVRRAFFDRVNVSLNFVEEGELRIRTLLERSSVEVFRNAEMVRRVVRAARIGNGALLDLPDDDYWYYLNAVLNVISSQFAEGYVRQEAGRGGVVEQSYLLFLTCENDGPMRQRKVRAMLIRESLLLEAQTQAPKFKNQWHEARWNTLRDVAMEWVSSGGKSPRIRQISIPV